MAVSVRSVAVGVGLCLVVAAAVTYLTAPRQPGDDGTSAHPQLRPRFRADEWVTLAAFRAFDFEPETVPGAPLRLVVAGEGGSSACSFAPNGPPQARCVPHARADSAIPRPSDLAVRDEKYVRLHTVLPGWLVGDRTGPTPEAPDVISNTVVARSLSASGSLGEQLSLVAMRKPSVVRGCRTASGEITIALVGESFDVRPGILMTRTASHEFAALFPDGSGGLVATVPAVIRTPPIAPGMFARYNRWLSFGCTVAGVPGWAWSQGRSVSRIDCDRHAGCSMRAGQLPPAADRGATMAAPVGDDEVIVVGRAKIAGRIGTYDWPVSVWRGRIDDLANAREELLEVGTDGPAAYDDAVEVVARGDTAWVLSLSRGKLHAYRFDANEAPPEVVTLAP